MPLRQLTAQPVWCGLLISSRVWTALLVWAGLPHADNALPSQMELPPDIRERFGAPPSAGSLALLSGLMILALIGGLRVLVPLAATGVADASVTLARRFSRWPALRTRKGVATLLPAKAMFLSLGFAGVFGDQETGGTWDRGHWAQRVLSGLGTGHRLARHRLRLPP